MKSTDYITLDDTCLTIEQWAKNCNTTAETIINRLKDGWTLENALLTWEK